MGHFLNIVKSGDLECNSVLFESVFLFLFFSTANAFISCISYSQGGWKSVPLFHKQF